MNEQGQHLQEVTVSFLLDEKINKRKAKIFLIDLINKIGLVIVRFSYNELFPGFDLACTLKESIVYFGYWGEYGYVRMYICSCKKYNSEIISNIIKENFKIKDNICIDIIKNITVREEMENLCQR